MSARSSERDHNNGHTANESVQTTMESMFKDLTSTESKSVSVRHYSDANPSNRSAAVVMATEDKTQEESYHSPEAEEETNKQLNYTSGSTIKHLEQTKTQRNKKINKLDEAIDLIGTGPSYSGGGIKKTFHGVSYQMKLAMVFTVRGMKQMCNFQVATEVEEAGKLDDLLFLYEQDEIGFFQAKHRLDNTFTINEDNLLSKEGDFSISKYFHSYLQILNQKEFRNILEDRDMVLIMNTNVDIDGSFLNNFELITSSTILSGNKILGLGTDEERAGFYIIKEDSLLYNKLIDLLQNLEEPSTQVAENLAKAVVNNKKKSLKIDDLFNRYRDWLFENILELGIEVIKSQNRYFVTFKDSFLCGEDDRVFNFRKAFMETYLSNKQKGKNEMTIAQHALNEEIVKQDLLDAKFQVPKSFAKKTQNEHKNEVSKFLDILVFAVNQPNENDLGNIIEKEIGDYVGHTDRKSIASKFKLYMQDWAKQKQGRYLTNVDVERQFSVWALDTLNQIRIDDIKKYNCTFEETNEVIKNLSNFLKTDNDANFFCLYDRQTLFTKIKVCQVLESFASGNVDQQFIFCEINDLIELEDTAKCPIKAFSSQTCNILFVSLEECKLHNTELKILNRLRKIVIEFNRNAEKTQSKMNNGHFKKKKRKYLIMSISEEKKNAFLNKFPFNDREIKSLSYQDFDNSFSELDEQSRRQLMDKGMNFHDKNIKDLLSEDELSVYIRNEILLTLISSELQINGASTESNNHYNDEVKQYYINRSLVPVTLNQNIKNDKQFHFMLDDTLQTNIENQDVVVISPNAELFERFSETNINVHWLTEKDHKYIWMTSQGNLSKLRKYVATQNLNECENCIPITNVSNLKNDVVIISASPGMGKSILLAHIVEQSRIEESPFFVFRANLANFFTELDSLDKEHVTLEQAIRFVFIATQIDCPHVEAKASAFKLLKIHKDGNIIFSPRASFSQLDHLRALVFCNLYNKRKIVLLLDGYDEIAPDYCRATSNLLIKLKQSKIRKMWITTRPYGFVETLEKDLDTFAYTLKPLSKDDQLKLIEKFWTPEIKSQPTEILSSINGFFSSLGDVELYTDPEMDLLTIQNPNISISSFMGVPLHIYMLAKVVTQSKYFAIDQSITVLDFYSRFFDIKFDEILYKVNLKDPKNDLFRERKKLAEIEFGKMALLEIFDEKLLIDLVPVDNRANIIDFVNSGMEKIGIVGEVVDNKPRFVHRTFAEYFAARYLANILLSSEENTKTAAAKSLLYNCVTSNLEYYSVIITFFNYIVCSSSTNKDIFNAVIRPNGQNIKKLVKADNWAMFDALNRTLLHLIAFNLEKVLTNIMFYFLYEKETIETIQQFSEIFQRPFSSCYSADTLFKWTLEHYLSMRPGFKEYGQEFTLLFLNFERDTYGRTPLFLWILKFQSFSGTWLHNDYLRYCFKIQINIQDNFLKTALHYLLENLGTPVLDDQVWYKHFSMVCLLLKYGASINVADSQGIKPVDIMKPVIIQKTEQILKNITENKECTTYKDNIIDFQHFIVQVEKHGYKIFDFDVDKVNATDFMGRTALHWAVRRRDKVAVWLLINQGARPDIADTEGKFPVDIDMEELLLLTQSLQQNLHTYEESYSFDIINFVEQFPPRIVEVLIATTKLLTLSPEDIEHKDIIVFILLKTKTIARTLLSKYPDLVNVADSKGKTALHYAVEQYDQERVAFLIECNAHIDITDNEGKMPAHINRFGDYSRLMEWMNKLPAQVLDPLVLMMDLYPILTQIDADAIVYVMSRSETIEIARILLSHYPNVVNTKDSRGGTALHYAVERKDRNAVCHLVDRNAQTAIANNDGKYPVHLENQNFHPHKTNEDTFDDFNKRMLGFVNTLPYKVAKPLVLTLALLPPLASSDYLPFIFDQKPTIAAVLWAVYSDLLGNNTFKEYSSYFDCTKVSNDVVCLLLECYNIEDFADIAVRSNDVLKLIVGLFSSVNNNDLAQVQNVLRCVEYSELNPNLSNVNILWGVMNVTAHVVNAKSKVEGKTALHYAAQIGNVEIAQSLLSHGAWYNVPDDHGSTPAQIAKSHGNTSVFHLLDTIQLLFDSINKKAYDVAKSVVTKENIEGNIFHCVCFETGSPLIHLAIESLYPYGYDVLKSFWKCYQFTTDAFNCRKPNGVGVAALLDKFLRNERPTPFDDLLYKKIILLLLELPNELIHLI